MELKPEQLAARGTTEPLHPVYLIAGPETLRVLEAADAVRFPGLHLSWQALKAPEGTTTVLNAANEVAVAAFLAERLPFDRIQAVNQATLAQLVPHERPASVAALLDLDAQARAVAAQIAQRWVV